MQTNIKLEKRMNNSSQSSEPIAKRLKTLEDTDQDEHVMVHCPRCDSTNTKFCYYNNYSLSQPRYFCKSCRRYWTKGGTLRNIPIGGVSRRNKKFSSVSIANHPRQPQPQPQPYYNKLPILPDVNSITLNSNSLQQSYPESPTSYPDFMFENLTIDFMELGSGRGVENEGNDHFPTILETGYGADTGNTHGLSPFGEMMSYYHEHYDKMMNGDDLKPKFELETGCYSELYGSSVGRNGSSGYLPSFGSSWTGLMNGYGSSSTNSLV